MKMLTLALLTFATVAQAGVPGSDVLRGRPVILPVNKDAQAIYEALNVEAVHLNPGVAGSGRFGKSVGGLSCEMSRVIVPNAVAHYSCTLLADGESDEVNHQAIFDALNVEPQYLNPGIAGRFRVRKQVGNLSCVTSQLLSSQEAHTSCVMVSKAQ